MFSSLPAKSIQAGRIIKKLPLHLTKRIRHFCSETFITPAVLFETALFTYLYKINMDNKAITLGVPVLNRNAKERKISGMFVSTMPLTVEISASDTIEHLARNITAQHQAVFRHQKYPYSQILKNLREKQEFSGNLYDVMVSYQNAQTQTDSYTEWYCNGYSEVPLVLHIDDRDNNGTFTLTVDYQVALFSSDKEVNFLMDRLECILEQIINNDSATVMDIAILPDAEKI